MCTAGRGSRACSLRLPRSDAWSRPPAPTRSQISTGQPHEFVAGTASTPAFYGRLFTQLLGLKTRLINRLSWSSRIAARQAPPSSDLGIQDSPLEPVTTRARLGQ